MIYLRRLITIFIVAILCITVSGCDAEKRNNTTIVATTLPVYEFTSALCQGTNIDVACLITDSISCLHDYSLQVRQMRSIEQADHIVISGMGLEDFMQDILPENKLIDASIGIECIHDGHNDTSHHHQHTHKDDPHIWLAPENAKKMAENIYNSLIVAYPQHKVIFTENKSILDSQFLSLIEYANKELSNITTRKIITFHDGFNYMAKAFGLTVLHSIEEEPGSEMSAAKLIELTNIVKKHDINVLFTEKNGSSASASVIAAETGAAIYSLDMALSDGNYFNVMYYNIKTLKEALK